jgi:hypothetical protein
MPKLERIDRGDRFTDYRYGKYEICQYQHTRTTKRFLILNEHGSRIGSDKTLKGATEIIDKLEGWK